MPELAVHLKFVKTAPPNRLSFCSAICNNRELDVLLGCLRLTGNFY